MFLLFGGYTYYAGGGWNDYLGSYFTADEAIIDGQAFMPDRIDWFHVVDLEHDKIVHYQGRG